MDRKMHACMTRRMDELTDGYSDEGKASSVEKKNQSRSQLCGDQMWVILWHFKCIKYTRNLILIF